MRLPFAAIALSLCFSLFASVALAQPKKPKANNEEADAEAAQQRTVAISLVTGLAEEARSFKDQTRRARVQARAADVLWDTDPERARELSCVWLQNAIANSAKNFSKPSTKQRKRHEARLRPISGITPRLD